METEITLDTLLCTNHAYLPTSGQSCLQVPNDALTHENSSIANSTLCSAGVISRQDQTRYIDMSDDAITQVEPLLQEIQSDVDQSQPTERSTLLIMVSRVSSKNV